MRSDHPTSVSRIPAVPSLLLALAVLLPGCQATDDAVATDNAVESDNAAAHRPVALIGWDGADWEIADPLLDAGRLPNLSRLLERGVRADLRSMTPVLSPLLWTTMATGRPPEVHGVLDFLQPGPSGGPPVPIGADARQVPALWEMAAASGRTVGIVGWWATHPAPQLPGFLVSDRFAYTILERGEAERSVGAVFPPDLESRIRPRLAADLSAEDLSPLPVSTGVGSPGDQDLRRFAAAALSYQQALLEGISQEGVAARGVAPGGPFDAQPDLVLAYFSWIDQVSHRFADCASPALPSCPDAERARFADVIPAAYEFQDRLLGELLGVLDPRTEVVLVSDHGFLSGSRRPVHVPPDVSGKPGRWHRREGILVMAGPGVRPHGTLPPVELLDVTPTVLALLGLPGARDMEGRARADALEDPVPEATLASWNDRAPITRAASPAAATEVDAGRLAELEALGYLSGAGARSLGNRSVAAEVNLASRLIQTGRPEQARAALDRALGRSPEYVPAWLALSEVQIRLGNRGRAAAHLARAIELEGGADADPVLFVRWAGLSGPGALQEPTASFLAGALRARPDSADLHVADGILVAGAGQAAAAVVSFEATLDLRPEHREGLAGLFALTRDGSYDPRAMESRLDRALQVRPESVLPRNWLALLLESRGEVGTAVALLEEALEQAPDHVGTWVNLGVLQGRSGDVDGAVSAFRRGLALDPQDVPAAVGLATTLARAGRLEEARAVLDDREGAGPQDPRLLNTLALVHRDLGDPEEAVRALRASLALLPEQPGARELLRELEENP